jgi:hypothetical protein
VRIAGVHAPVWADDAVIQGTACIEHRDVAVSCLAAYP